MKKLLIGFLLSAVTFNCLATMNENELLGEDRIYLTETKNVWIYYKGMVANPPFVSFWFGVNGKNTQPKSKSVRVFMTLDCKSRKQRYEAIFQYSQSDNNGKVLERNYSTYPWRPVEPDGLFNTMFESACIALKNITHPN